MTPTKWTRVSRRRQCPICKRPDWCLLAGPEDAPTVAICARIESSHRCGEAGWLHRLRDDDWSPPFRRSRQITSREATKPASRNWHKFVSDCEAELSGDRREALTAELGVSADALVRLGSGYSSEHRAFTFPMFNATGEILGVRLRGREGRKWSVRGGREGLFLPRPNDQDAVDRIVVCEGPTDCASLLDFGFVAIGRPSCSGGVKHITELVKRLRPSDVVILADDDPPGLRGASNLASVLTLYVQYLFVITPPPGVKDARQWKQQGASHDDMLQRIDDSEPIRLGITAKGGNQ